VQALPEREGTAVDLSEAANILCSRPRFLAEWIVGKPYLTGLGKGFPSSAKKCESLSDRSRKPLEKSNISHLCHLIGQVIADDTNGSPFRAEELVVIVHRTQVVLIDSCADSPAQVRTSLLVGSKMYSAVNTRVGDVAGNLLK